MQGMDQSILNLLATMGSTITLRSNSQDSPYDPETATVAFTPTDVSVTACIVNYRDEELINTSIQQKDRKVIIAAKDIAATPKIEDQIIAFSNTYEVIRVQEIKCGAVIIAYILQVRI